MNAVSEQPNFNGSDYVPARDNARLNKQFTRIFNLMKDAQWRTLNAIETCTGYPQASISAQLRHMRKERFGEHTVNKRLQPGSAGTYEYQLVVNPNGVGN